MCKICRNLLAEHERKKNTVQLGYVNKMINKDKLITYMKLLFHNFFCLCEFFIDRHNLDIQYKCTIFFSVHTTVLFQIFFSYNIATLYNKVLSDTKLSSRGKFKIVIREYIHGLL